MEDFETVNKAIEESMLILKEMEKRGFVNTQDIFTEFDRLKELSTRWYLADGSFETLPEEEVIKRRKIAANVLGNCRII